MQPSRLSVKLRVLACRIFTVLWLIAFESAEATKLSAADIDFFERYVRPLLVERCYECHAGTEINGGLRLDSKSHSMAGGDSGKAIIPGDIDSSLLIAAVRYKNPDLQMPPKKRLSADEVSILERWVTMGAPDPRLEPAPNSVVVPSGMSIEDGRQFWSMRSIADPSIPQVGQIDWPKTPIDAFVLSKLESNALTPNRSAEKRLLIRRATLDLIGIPPTPEEVRRFLEDEAEEAFERVVDRLLQSPEYGVRWGRHWLDVARYADSNGLDENLAFGNAWRYRDYVIEAFNRDKPFDRFLIEQVAGDLIPDANLETRIATGFLVLGAKVLAEPDKEKLVMDTIDEQLDTLGKTFWGMTLGCVRCHDHKFDPLKQTDYYALAAIFRSTKTFGDTKEGAIKHWNEYDFPDPTMPTGSRNQTTIPSQALAMMNSELVLHCSESLADRLIQSESSLDDRVQMAFSTVYGRRASSDDLQLSRAFFDETAKIKPESVSTSEITDEQLAWSLYCQSLLASNEFFFVR